MEKAYCHFSGEAKTMQRKASDTRLRKPSCKITQTLADNMRTFRKARGVSQEAFAELCQLHRTYIGSVERGERNVTLGTLEAIAGAMEIIVPQLLTEGGVGDDFEG